MRIKMWAVVVLLSIWISPTLSLEVSLEQIFPVEGDPICLGTILKYKCTLQEFSLRWKYDSQVPVSQIFFSSDGSQVINKTFEMGPFNVVLININFSDSPPLLTSSATLRDGLMADANDRIISCLGPDQQKDNIQIMVTEINIENASVCLNTIYWSPPPCNANCTIHVDGREFDTVPCSTGKLTIGDNPDLSNKTLSINATDPLGRSMLVENISIEDCAMSVLSSVITTPTASTTPAARTNTALVIIGISVAVVHVILIAVSFLVVPVLVIWFKRKGNNDPKDKVKQTEMNNQEEKHRFYSFEVIDKRSHGNHDWSIAHCTVSLDAEYIATVDVDSALRLWKPGSDRNELVDIKSMNSLKNPKSALGTKHSEVDPKMLESKYWKDGGMKRLVSLNWVHKADMKQLMLTYSKFVMIYDISRSAVSVVFSAQKRATFHKCESTTPRIFCGACSPSDFTFAVSYTTKLADENVCGRLELGQTRYSSEQDYVELVSKEAPVTSMSFSQDGKLLAAGSINGDIEVYDCTDPSQPPRTWKAHIGMVHDVQFNVHHVDDKSEMKVFSMGEDNKFCVLDMSKETDPVKHAELDPKQERLFCQEPSYLAQVSEKKGLFQKKVHKTFHYLARSKLFALGIDNKFILIASPNGGILYQDDGNFQLKKFQELCPGLPVSCVDWVFHGNVITCVMGCGRNTVQMFKLTPQSSSELTATTEASASNTIIELGQPLSLEGKPQQRMSAEPSYKAVLLSIPATVPAAQGDVEKKKPNSEDQKQSNPQEDQKPTIQAPQQLAVTCIVPSTSGTITGQKNITEKEELSAIAEHQPNGNSVQLSVQPEVTLGKHHENPHKEAKLSASLNASLNATVEVHPLSNLDSITSQSKIVGLVSTETEFTAAIETDV